MRTIQCAVAAVLAAGAVTAAVPAVAAPRPPAGLVTSGRQLTVTATIPVGGTPNAIDENPYTNRIYVANEDSDTVSVISGKTSKVLATIPVGSDPFTLAVNPLSNKIYVGNVESNSVSVISGKKNAVIATIKDRLPISLAIDPLTSRIYTAASLNAGRLNIISMRTDKVIGSVRVGRVPAGVAVNPLTNRIYVTNAFANTVSVVSGRTEKVIATIGVGEFPQNIAVNPVTNKIYVVCGSPGQYQVVSGRTNAVTATVTADAFGISIDPYANLIYGVNASTVGDAEAINGASNQVISSVAVGAVPYGIVIDPITDVAYAAVTGDNTVAVLRWRKVS
jgi:YVTN family beta-propeller protein